MASTSRLFSSTFASRQHAISLPSTVSSPNPNNPAASRRSMEPSHPHPLRSIHVRHAASPTPSRVSVILPSVSGARRPFPSWGPPPPLPSSSNLRKSTPHGINTPMSSGNRTLPIRRASWTWQLAMLSTSSPLTLTSRSKWPKICGKTKAGNAG